MSEPVSHDSSRGQRLGPDQRYESIHERTQDEWEEAMAADHWEEARDMGLIHDAKHYDYNENFSNPVDRHSREMFDIKDEASWTQAAQGRDDDFGYGQNPFTNWWRSSNSLYEDMSKSTRMESWQEPVARAFVQGFMSPFKRVTEGKWYSRGAAKGVAPSVPHKNVSRTKTWKRTPQFFNDRAPRSTWRKNKKCKTSYDEYDTYYYHPPSRKFSNGWPAKKIPKRWKKTW